MWPKAHGCGIVFTHTQFSSLLFVMTTDFFDFSPNSTIISDKQSHINKLIRTIRVISLNIYKSLHFTAIAAVIAVLVETSIK